MSPRVQRVKEMMNDQSNVHKPKSEFLGLSLSDLYPSYVLYLDVKRM